MIPEVVVKEALTKEYLKETIEKLAKKHDFNMYVDAKGHVTFDEPMVKRDDVFRIIRELAKELAETKSELWITQFSSKHHHTTNP